MELQTLIYLVVGASFALYIGIAIRTLAASTGEFMARGTAAPPAQIQHLVEDIPVPRSARLRPEH